MRIQNLSRFGRWRLLTDAVQRFRHDASGMIAVLATLMLVVVTLAVGIAVDFTRGSLQRQALNAAIDAAALAVAASSVTDSDQLEQLAREYIAANYSSQGYSSSDLSLSIEITANKVAIAASQQMPTMLMKMAQINTMELESYTEVSRSIGNIEVVLVLDNTGSMLTDDKLEALKEAATELTDTLFGDDTESDTLKIGIVPFSVSVNVGAQYTSETWLDHNGLNSISHLNFTDSTKHNSWAWGQLSNMEWNGCVEQRKVATGIDYDIDDTIPTTSDPNTIFPIYFAPDEPTNSNSGSSKSGWGTGFPNNYLSDWRSDETPNSSMSLDSRQRRYEKYVGTSVNSTTKGPGYLCGIPALSPLTGTKQTITDALDDMIANGGTNIATGVGWGLRVLSPTVPFTEGAAYDDDDWSKLMIIMTDGDNDWGSSLSNMNKSYYSGYGYASQSATRLGLSSVPSTDTALDAVFNARTTAACDAVKSATGDADHAITVYTITFGTALTDSARTLMGDCASDAEKYFHAPDSATLQDVFDEIGTQIRDIYISK
ncbi:MAG TPA: pilus assembly protein TadG-related protein [Aestuariivirgaceae bacterium]|nr:pilus assembly protein TadG-related protein [Aestuariivirgaceae bacterium]